MEKFDSDRFKVNLLKDRIVLIEEIKSEFISKIKEIMPSELTILAIVITGSRGKCLYSEDSDYDVKVIFKDNFDNYLLQIAKNNIKLKTSITINGILIQLEGQAVDLITIFEYAYKTNAFVSEVIRGFLIYEHTSIKIMKPLRHTYLYCFNIELAVHQIFGLISAELAKMKIDKKKELTEKNFKKTVLAKQLCELNYLVSSVNYLIQNGADKWINTYTVYDYLKSDLKVYNDFPSFKPYYFEILERRIINRNEEIFVNEEKLNLISQLYENLKTSIKVLKESDFTNTNLDMYRKEYESYILSILKNDLFLTEKELK